MRVKTKTESTELRLIPIKFFQIVTEKRKETNLKNKKKKPEKKNVDKEKMKLF